MQVRAGLSELEPEVISPWCRGRTKRVFDLVCGLILAILTAPLMAAVALAVRVSSPGPIIFRQLRSGLGGTQIVILKFRTMFYSKTPNGAGITATGDQRVTATGRLLRKWKLDELPQLINVIRGDMSMVGPRPDLPEYLAHLPQGMRDLFRLRPGITGWATLHYRHEEQLLASVPGDSVNDYYLYVVMPEKARLDLAYGKGATFWTDLSVLFRTATAVVS